MNTDFEEAKGVLIVDDQQNWLETLTEALEPGYQIATATNLEEATRELSQRAYHVVVTDLRLVDANPKNVDGLLLLDEVKKHTDGTQVILVTGYPTIATTKAALKGRDAFDYLLKVPEQGGFFKIREYRDCVREAAKLAANERQKAITLNFSVAALIKGRSLQDIGLSLLPDSTNGPAAAEAFGTAVKQALYKVQPLARDMSRVRMPRGKHTVEILCWSRRQGTAVLVRVGANPEALASGAASWGAKRWELTRAGESKPAALVAVAYTVNGMSYEDFAGLVQRG